MSTYTPDRWVVVKIESPGEEAWYRVFAGWYGGFTSGDSWKMSSGIVKAVEYEDRYEVENTSGSIYVCYKGTLEDGSRGGDLGVSGYMIAVLQSFQKQYAEKQVTLEVVDFMPLLEKVAE